MFCPSRPTPPEALEDTIGELARLKKEGKIRFIGVSEAGPSFIRRAAKVHPLVSLQMEYSLLSREIEAEHLPLCKELGMSIMAYAPFARGLLTGNFRPDAPGSNDHRGNYERFKPENYERNMCLLDTARTLAQARYISLPRLAVAWVLAKGAPLIPFPGCKTRAHLEDILGALEVRLSEDELQQLDAAYPGRRRGQSLFGCAARGVASMGLPDVTAQNRRAVDLLRHQYRPVAVASRSRRRR